jgi:hypothetical protein
MHVDFATRLLKVGARRCLLKPRTGERTKAGKPRSLLKPIPCTADTSCSLSSDLNFKRSLPWKAPYPGTWHLNYAGGLAPKL